MKNKRNYLAAISGASLVGTLSILASPQAAQAITFVLDFKDSTQGVTRDIFNYNTGGGVHVGEFDVSDFGFAKTEANFDLVTNAVFEKVQSHYYDIPTFSQYGGTTTSPIADGKELDINFEIADLDETLDGSIINDFVPAAPDDQGTAANGYEGDFYFVQIGSFDSDPTNVLQGNTGVLGLAPLSFVRDSVGNKGNSGFTMNQAESIPISSILSDRIGNLDLTGASNPNILNEGNLEATVNALAGTISHEIGHALSLEHVYNESSETPGDVPPILGTGALDLFNTSRIEERAFSFSAFGEAPSTDLPLESDPIPHFDEAEPPGGIPFSDIPAGSPTLNNVQQLVDASNVRDSAAVPFEFSPAMGLLLVGSTWGFATWRKKNQLKDFSR